jgi:phosphomannomutase
MHGCWAGKARRYLQAIFPQGLFSTINDVVDGRFDGGVQRGANASGLHDLRAAVYRQRAQLGVAFDGDGDRLTLVDEEGVALTPEESACALLECVGGQLPGQPFVYDLRFSDQIAEAARQMGAEPLAERPGHGFLRTRMRKADAAFGAAIGGQYFHRTLDGRCDPLYTICHLIAYLYRSQRTLGELRRGCPPIYMTPELRLPMPPDVQEATIGQVMAAWAEFPQRTADGVRIDTPGGWALVRSSTTEPALTFRFEGLDWHALEDLVERFCDVLPGCGDQLWECYVNQR